jgi:hypothetical protein
MCLIFVLVRNSTNVFKKMSYEQFVNETFNEVLYKISDALYKLEYEDEENP